MYAVIDLEATGGKPSEERIIEVAIFLYDGKDIVDQFISLINPDCPIPPFVQKLTGIKQRDVQGAPRFHEVAKRIVQMTDGAIFVAHNAPFDYRVLREEFARLGYDYQRTVLDTIPLAQKFIPDLPAYGLATLCEELGITNAKRHRADGDARATVKLLEILLEKDREKYIEGVYLKQPSATGKHPFSKQIEPLVKTTGIYYLFNEDGTVIYIGKSDQLRVRIDRHFLSTNEKALALQNEVKSLRVEETGSLVLAEILEHLALKKLRPAYNTPKDKYSLRLGSFPWKARMAEFCGTCGAFAASNPFSKSRTSPRATPSWRASPYAAAIPRRPSPCPNTSTASPRRCAPSTLKAKTSRRSAAH